MCPNIQKIALATRELRKQLFGSPIDVSFRDIHRSRALTPYRQINRRARWQTHSAIALEYSLGKLPHGIARKPANYSNLTNKFYVDEVKFFDVHPRDFIPVKQVIKITVRIDNRNDRPT